MARTPAPKKERTWTEIELKYLALVLADEKNQFAVRLETLVLSPGQTDSQVVAS